MGTLVILKTLKIKTCGFHERTHKELAILRPAIQFFQKNLRTMVINPNCQGLFPFLIIPQIWLAPK
jgi:hypothetical protein